MTGVSEAGLLLGLVRWRSAALADRPLPELPAAQILRRRRFVYGDGHALSPGTPRGAARSERQRRFRCSEPVDSRRRQVKTLRSGQWMPTPVWGWRYGLS